jgi:hypothetical protein
MVLFFPHHELQHEQDKKRGQHRDDDTTGEPGGTSTNELSLPSLSQENLLVLNPGIFSNPGVLLVLLLSAVLHDSLT